MSNDSRERNRTVWNYRPIYSLTNVQFGYKFMLRFDFEQNIMLTVIEQLNFQGGFEKSGFIAAFTFTTNENKQVGYRYASNLAQQKIIKKICKADCSYSLRALQCKRLLIPLHFLCLSKAFIEARSQFQKLEILISRITPSLLFSYR